MEHEKLEDLIMTESNDYITSLISQIKKLTSFFKKISKIDQTVFKNSSDEYSKLHRNIEKKLESLIKKFFILIDRDTENFDMNNFNYIVNGVDDMLENVSNNIDIIKGIKKEKNDEDIKNELKAVKENEFKKTKIFKNENLMNNISDIDNSYYPFIPKIREKPNSKVPLSKDIIEAAKLRDENKKYEINFSDSKNEKLRTSLFYNPYQEEINDFIKSEEKKYNILTEKYIKNRIKNKIKFPIIKKDSEIENNEFSFPIEKYLPINETKLSFIETEESLNEMIEKLKSSKEISIDLEHHSKESYLGITCLIQISNRKEDFIIDSLKLRNNLQILNIIFTNPEIIKIFHGGDYDIEWLQKDFGLYIVNMFDTGRASRILKYPSYALKYLLKEICDVDTDKKYQLADWRIRPLSKDMINYARGDTHYLLYIYDILKKNLIEKSLSYDENDPFKLFFETIKQSNEIAMKSYQKPIVINEFYQFIKYHLNKSNREIGLLEEIFLFRDYLARKLNVNPSYVMSNKLITKLSKLKEFSTESVVLEIGGISPLLRYINEFIEVCNNKIVEIEKNEKLNSKESNEEREREYISKVKKLIEYDEERNKIKFGRNINNENLEKNRKDLEDLMEKINISNNLDFDISKSRFAKDLKPNNNNKNIISPFNNFQLVNYLKNKHNIQTVTMKVSNNNENNQLNNKREINRYNENKDEDEDEDIILKGISKNEKEKIKKMNDITDNEKIFLALQKNRLEQLNENDSSSESEINSEDEEKITIPKDFYKKERKYKNFVKNNKNYNYNIEQKKKFRGKKRKNK